MSPSFVSIVEAQIAGGKVKLPVFGGTALNLQRMLANPPDTTKPIEGLLASDPVLASAVLRLANSSFFGGLAQVKTIHDALLRLGMNQVMRIALVVSQQQAYRVKTKDMQPVVSALWIHALATAIGAQWLAQKVGRGAIAAEAFLAGMVHDIGKLLVVRVIDDLRATRPDFRPPAGLVTEMLDSLHAKYGGHLARGWNLPDAYVRVIEHHHDPEPAQSDTLLTLVRLVDQATNSLGYGLHAKHEAQLAATREAQLLGLTDVLVAELEIHLEDSVAATQAAAG